MSKYAVTASAIQDAAQRIAGLVHRTPVHTCQAINAHAGRELFFKCENLQKVGAFKARGATHAVGRLDDVAAARGVVTHSSGNHAQALALAARQRGIPAWIVMPTSAPKIKQHAVAGYGATIVPCEPTLAARETTAARVQSETGATFIHPYDDPQIIAGQGTVALELLDQVPDLDAIVAPIGGGGLMSGICLAARDISQHITLLAAEPAGADDAARSLASGQRILQTDPNTIADGLLTSLGELTWPIVRDQLSQIITVSDEQIVEAMRWLWERAKLVVEPSGAVSLAAVLSDEMTAYPALRRVGVVLSGGNVDLDRLPW